MWPGWSEPFYAREGCEQRGAGEEADPAHVLSGESEEESFSDEGTTHEL